MGICKKHKECFEKICSLCGDYEPLASHDYEIMRADRDRWKARCEAAENVIGALKSHNEGWEGKHAYLESLETWKSKMEGGL